ncbi:MAG: arylamine N-acetyltransferase [Planctomycetota bacterium]|nr:arylamine N-acetyltransferase [Planctomycetota bacterium]
MTEKVGDGRPGCVVAGLELGPGKVEGVLGRIGYCGVREAGAGSLRALHEAFILAVPFENLDIMKGRRVRLEVGAFYEKIVKQGRGGFCYELNGLFAALLVNLGFDVTLLSARVIGEDGVLGPEFDHLVLLVKTPERWLADVGFGSSFRLPLKLDEEGEQADFRCSYRLGRSREEITVYQKRLLEGEWFREYIFTLKPRRLGEFAATCLWQQTSPDSSFVRLRFCTLGTRTGRVTLMGNRLIVTHEGRRVVRDIEEREVAGILKEHFGIEEGG